MISPGARKRSPDRHSPSCATQEEQPPSAKRRRVDEPNTHNTNVYPPRFWDTLSTVRLTQRALEEFERRHNGCVPTRNPAVTASSRRLLRSDIWRLRQLADSGGPDLSAIQGYSDIPVVNTAMSQSRTGSKRSSASGSGPPVTVKTKSTTPYSGEFEQKLVDRGIYPDEYEDGDGNSTSEPQNINDIRAALAQSRGSLSPSQFPAAAFKQFKQTNHRAKLETNCMTNVLPIIAGEKDRDFESAGDVPFTRLEKFDPDLSIPRPDLYYGSKPSDIDRRVRRDLGTYIEPSNRTNLPAAPNFFLEGKSAAGRPDVAQRQAMYDGAVGARAMFHLQNYGTPTPAYDGNAYTLSSTYCDGQLKMYATHPRPPAGNAGDGPEYYMNQLGAYAMTNNPATFREGAAAYRNAREWTQKQRNRLVTDANGVAQRMPGQTGTVRATGAGNRTTSRQVETVVDTSPDPDTSADELAYDPNSKRPRR